MVAEHSLAKHLQTFCHFTQCLRTRWYRGAEAGLSWEKGGRFQREGARVWLWPIHVDVWHSSSVAQSCLTLRLHGLQHTNPPCPSPSLLKLMSIELVMPSNHLILCHPLLLLPSIFPSIRVFSNESVPHIRWPKYWSFSFSINPSNEYSGLISFRIDWLDFLAVRDSQKSSPRPQFKFICSSGLSFLCGPTLTSIHDYWKNHNFD